MSIFAGFLKRILFDFGADMPKNKDCAVLDIGSYKLTVLAGAHGINNIFNIKGKGEAVYGGFADGEFLEPDKLAAAFKQAVAEAENSMKNRIKYLYIGVPGEFCTAVARESSIAFKNRRKVTDIDVNELFTSENIKSKNYSLIGSEPVYYILDDNKKTLSPVGTVSGRLTGLLSFVFAENRFLDTVKKILDGLNLTSYEFVPSVLAEAMLLFDEKEKQVIFADIGYLTSGVALCQGNGLLYMKSFSAGGAHISADLMECLHISYPLAQSLKEEIKLNLEVSKEDRYKVSAKTESAEIPMDTANGIVAARIEMFAEMVKRCLKDCPYEIPQYTPLCLTGGGISYIRGAKDILSAALDRNVEIVSPAVPQINKPHLSSAYGVLNYAIGKEKETKKGFWAKLLG